MCKVVLLMCFNFNIQESNILFLMSLCFMQFFLLHKPFLCKACQTSSMLTDTLCVWVSEAFEYLTIFQKMPTLMIMCC